MSVTRRGLFLLPEVVARQAPPVAGMINAGQLARACQELLGEAWVSVSHHQSWRLPEAVIHAGSESRVGTAAATSSAASAPPPPSSRDGVFRRTAKDLRRLNWNLRYRSPPPGETPVAFVWQRLDPWFIAGPRLAKSLGVPLIVSVHSAVVAERRKWGSGGLPLDGLLARGERYVLAAADVVCPVSWELVEELAALGFNSDDPRLRLTPNQVDCERFRPMPSVAARRRYELGICGDELVVGWSGSFRAFHRLDLLIDLHRCLAALPQPPRVRFLLIGDGAQRSSLEAACAEAKVPALFPGVVPYAEVPEWLSVMDIGLVLGSEESGSFHYSPVKLREFLACGVPVVASRVGEVGRLFSDGGMKVLLAEDARQLAEVIGTLASDRWYLADLARRARSLALAEEGWEGQLRRILTAAGVSLPPE